MASYKEVFSCKKQNPTSVSLRERGRVGLWKEYRVFHGAPWHFSRASGRDEKCREGPGMQTAVLCHWPLQLCDFCHWWAAWLLHSAPPHRAATLSPTQTSFQIPWTEVLIGPVLFSCASLLQSTGLLNQDQVVQIQPPLPMFVLRWEDMPKHLPFNSVG